MRELLPEPEIATWHDPDGQRSNVRPGEVHIWRADVPQMLTPAVTATLSEAERRYAQRMTSDSAQRQFSAAQAALRTALARYIGHSPASIEFRRGEHGKPFLTEQYQSELQFNLSHSHDLAIVAVTNGSEIGVDLEKVRDRPTAQRLAARFFADGERAAMDSAPADQRERSFFRLWTRKEGHLKATGTGLSVTLRAIDTLAPAPAWWYHEFQPAAEYVATLVGTGNRPRVTYWNLQLPT